MSSEPREAIVVELPLAAVSSGGPLRARLEAIHEQDWLRHGIRRWLDLLDSSGRWPVVVLAATTAADDVQAPAALLGTIVGVHAPAPVERFDDLLTTAHPAAPSASARPAGGTWHFIAITTDPALRGGGLSRQLLDAALAFVARQPGDPAARTLSPADGLADALAAMAIGPATPTAERHAAIARVICRLGDDQGEPWLRILRLHPRRGAALERALFASRADEIRSANITLRFRYPLESDARATHRTRVHAWQERRAAAAPSAPAGPLPQTRWLPDCGDADVFPHQLLQLLLQLPADHVILRAGPPDEPAGQC